MRNSEKRHINFSPPDITELELEGINEVLKSGWITTGMKTKAFENNLAEYIGVNKVACLSSATAAMEITLRILGIGPGDEVITSAYTYTATASVIDHVGARIVLVDTQKDSFEMDYEKLRAAITEKTKVIIPVDIGGVLCDYEEVYRAALEKRHLFKSRNTFQGIFDRIIILGDSAHAFGARRGGKNAGQIADFTVFSFHAVKNLTTSEGGAVTWRNSSFIDDNWLYKQFMLYSLHGQSKDALAKTEKGSWEYDVLFPAYKCNMTDISAAFGLAQLKRYDSLLKRRSELIGLYDKSMNDLEVTRIRHFGEDFSSSGHLYMIRLPGFNEKERNEVIASLAEAGVSCNVHFKPLPMFTAYKRLGFDIKNYPNAFNMYQNELTLPLHTLLSNEDVSYVCDRLSEIVLKVKEDRNNVQELC